MAHSYVGTNGVFIVERGGLGGHPHGPKKSDFLTFVFVFRGTLGSLWSLKGPMGATPYGGMGPMVPAEGPSGTHASLAPPERGAANNYAQDHHTNSFSEKRQAEVSRSLAKV